jgi:hypothetical protein
LCSAPLLTLFTPDTVWLRVSLWWDSPRCDTRVGCWMRWWGYEAGVLFALRTEGSESLDCGPLVLLPIPFRRAKNTTNQIKCFCTGRWVTRWTDRAAMCSLLCYVYRLFGWKMKEKISESCEGAKGRIYQTISEQDAQHVRLAALGDMSSWGNRGYRPADGLHDNATVPGPGMSHLNGLKYHLSR